MSKILLNAFNAEDTKTTGKLKWKIESPFVLVATSGILEYSIQGNKNVNLMAAEYIPHLYYQGIYLPDVTHNKNIFGRYTSPLLKKAKQACEKHLESAPKWAKDPTKQRSDEDSILWYMRKASEEYGIHPQEFLPTYNGSYGSPRHDLAKAANIDPKKLTDRFLARAEVETWEYYERWTLKDRKNPATNNLFKSFKTYYFDRNKWCIRSAETEYQKYIRLYNEYLILGYNQENAALLAIMPRGSPGPSSAHFKEHVRQKGYRKHAYVESILGRAVEPVVTVSADGKKTIQKDTDFWGYREGTRAYAINEAVSRKAKTAKTIEKESKATSVSSHLNTLIDRGLIVKVKLKGGSLAYRLPINKAERISAKKRRKQFLKNQRKS